MIDNDKSDVYSSFNDLEGRHEHYEARAVDADRGRQISWGNTPSRSSAHHAGDRYAVRIRVDVHAGGIGRMARQATTLWWGAPKSARRDGSTDTPGVTDAQQNEVIAGDGVPRGDGT